MEKFSDFADERPLTGDKISINDLIGKEIVVKGYRLSDSNKRPGTKCLTLHVDVDGEERVAFTGSAVLIEQIEKYKEHIPFQTTIKKANAFLTFS